MVDALILEEFEDLEGRSRVLERYQLPGVLLRDRKCPEQEMGEFMGQCPFVGLEIELFFSENLHAGRDKDPRAVGDREEPAEARKVLVKNGGRSYPHLPPHEG